METSSPVLSDTRALTIPHLDAAEAYQLLQVQFERLLALLESLEPQDWSQPTVCTLWSVKDMVAHQAGGYTSGSSYAEMWRQYRVMLKPGGLPEDAINELQVHERVNRTPAELIKELRAAGPQAMRNWAYGFRLIKPVPFPHPIAGWRTLRYLMWVIHSRDTWMHRLDICRATGRTFIQDSHDRRVVELVMQDVIQVLPKKLQGETIQIDLSGVSGGSWRIGHGKPAATITMDALEFNIYVSGRSPYPVAIDQAVITGDAELATSALKDLLILY